jgi:hypothetical protein
MHKPPGPIYNPGMIDAAPASRQLPLPKDSAFVAGGLVLLTAVLAGSYEIATATGEALTRNTVRLSLAWYAAALVLMMHLDQRDWAAATPLGRAARWCWTWGIACFLVHLAMAFHYYHHWSHTHAFNHTRDVSGIGEGIYVSYLFTWLWIGDAAWWWIRPSSYAARPAWIDRTLHAFMLLIVFNGMIVFESGAIRWAGVAMFAALAYAWRRALQSSDSLASAGRAGEGESGEYTA